MHKYMLIYVLQRRRSYSTALGRGSADGVRRGKAAPTLPYAPPSDDAATARGTRSTHQPLGVLAEPVERAHDALARERVERAELRRRVLRRRRRRACAARLKPPRADTAGGQRPTATGLSANGNGHPHALRTETGDGRRGAAPTESGSRCARGAKARRLPSCAGAALHHRALHWAAPSAGASRTAACGQAVRGKHAARRSAGASSAACCALHAVHCSGCVRPLPRGAPVATNRSGSRDSRG